MRALAPILAGLMVIALPAAAQDAASAKAFLTALYASYHGDGPDIFGKQASKVFSPRLRGLIRRDRELAHGEVGALDGDPVCNCQDFEIKDVSVEATLKGPGLAQATAKFRNFGKPEVVRLDLVAGAGGWRIDNIHEDGTPDLAAYLAKHAGGR